jgi:hypothetical protein
MLRRVALVRTEVSEERSASFIKVTRIGELALFLVHRVLSPWWRIAKFVRNVGYYNSHTS